MSISYCSLICIVFYCASASAPCDPGWGQARFPDPNDKCELCRPGFFDAGKAVCEPCMPGTYQSDFGQIKCISCPPGSHSVSGASSCVFCPDGQVLLETNTCGKCPPGQYYEYFDAYCNPCDRGFFKADEGQGPCLPCPINSYSTLGASECTPCPEGHVLLYNGTCGQCPPGRFYDRLSNTCEDCEPGSYTDSQNNLDKCYKCGGNSFSPARANECHECPFGKVYIGSSDSCEECQPGQFYNEYKLSCQSCPYNHFSNGKNERRCRVCSPDSFARRESVTCFGCTKGEFFIAELDGCGTCPEAYDYYNARCSREFAYPMEETLCSEWHGVNPSWLPFDYEDEKDTFELSIEDDYIGPTPDSIE